MDTLMRVVAIVAQTLSVEPQEVGLDSSLQADLGADSLHLAEITMALEVEFDIGIAEEEAAKLNTVRQIVSAIERLKRGGD